MKLKKSLLIIFLSIMIFSLVGCGKSTKKEDNNVSSENNITKDEEKNSEDNVIEDYPLPDPDTCGTVRFSKDGTRMMDGNGESYKVYEDNNMDESYLDDYEYFDGIEDED